MLTFACHNTGSLDAWTLKHVDVEAIRVIIPENIENIVFGGSDTDIFLVFKSNKIFFRIYVDFYGQSIRHIRRTFKCFSATCLSLPLTRIRVWFLGSLGNQWSRRTETNKKAYTNTNLCDLGYLFKKLCNKLNAIKRDRSYSNLFCFISIFFPFPFYDIDVLVLVVMHHFKSNTFICNWNVCFSIDWSTQELSTVKMDFIAFKASDLIIPPR